jgi:hypothetical protein
MSEYFDVLFILKWVVTPFGYVIVVLLGVELPAPRGRVVIEQVWWRLVLGNSPASRSLRREMRDDLKLSVERWVIDYSTPRPLAVLPAIFARPFELNRLTHDLRCVKSEMIVETFESAIKQLNAGWREGLGEFMKAMRLMADQWSRYYALLDDNDRERLRARLSGYLILNPILAIPRHIILAAAFNERPLFEPKCWPSEAVYNSLAPEERECKIRWVDAWYEEAKRVCPSEPTSLSFSHAYAGFYFTLLLLESGMPSAYLHDRINEAFDAIDDSSAIVAQYVKYGFQGVYNLVCGEDEKALEHLSQAATLSAISGNRFADSIFMCSHAVAAARLNRESRYLAPDISYYLSKADRLARKINRPFYKKLCYGAKSAVCLLRGERAKAHRYAAWSKHGTTGDRILKIFYRDGQEP